MLDLSDAPCGGYAAAATTPVLRALRGAGISPGGNLMRRVIFSLVVAAPVAAE